MDGMKDVTHDLRLAGARFEYAGADNNHNCIWVSMQLVNRNL